MPGTAFIYFLCNFAQVFLVDNIKCVKCRLLVKKKKNMETNIRKRHLEEASLIQKKTKNDWQKRQEYISWEYNYDDNDENTYPPFDDWGDPLFEHEIKEIEDPDKLENIYTHAFERWNDRTMRQLCDILMFMMCDKIGLSPDIDSIVDPKDKGDVLSHYMVQSQLHSQFTNITRELIFPCFRTLLFAKSETLKKNKHRLLDWATGFRNSQNKEKLWSSPTYYQLDTTEKKSCNTLSPHDYKSNGTIMHIYAGYSVMQDVLNVYQLNGFDTMIPGRIVSRKLPYLASTPDFCILPDESFFSNIYKDAINNKGGISHELKQYTPQIWAEIKTIQKKDGIIKKNQLEDLYQLIANLFMIKREYPITGSLSDILEIDDWYSHEYVNEEDHNDEQYIISRCKEEVLKILTKCFIKVGWMPNKDKAHNKQKKPISLLMQRNTRLAEASFANVCKEGKVSKRQLQHLFSQDLNNVIPISPLIQAGRAWIFVYGKSGEKDKCLLSLSFEEAPFILGPVSDFYIQILEQACCVQYINSAACHLFIAITKHESDNNNNINRPCIAYVYEILLPDCVRKQYEMQCFLTAHKYLGFPTPLATCGQKYIHTFMWNDEDHDRSLCLLNDVKERVLREK